MKKPLFFIIFSVNFSIPLFSQENKKQASRKAIHLEKIKDQNKINVLVGNQLFTSFLYPDTLEKPVLYPIIASNGIAVNRGFPMNTIAGEPTDHPHHLGIWFNFENVNGLDFWNNSSTIPADKKHLYGWIKTDRIIQTKSGKKGILKYHANWTNQNNATLIEETTTFTFTSIGNTNIIDRTTILKADSNILFTDSKDGMLGFRAAHELQTPQLTDKKFVDNKGNVTIVKADYNIPTGTYLTSEGKQGDSAWGTRASWCKMYGKMKNDSVSVVMIDHPNNPNYPTFWMARGYGLFAANPLGEKIYTNGKSEKNLQIKKGDCITFKYRIVVDSDKKSLSKEAIENLQTQFIYE